MTEEMMDIVLRQLAWYAATQVMFSGLKPKNALYEIWICNEDLESAYVSELEYWKGEFNG